MVLLTTAASASGRVKSISDAIRYAAGRELAKATVFHGISMFLCFCFPRFPSPSMRNLRIPSSQIAQKRRNPGALVRGPVH